MTTDRPTDQEILTEIEADVIQGLTRIKFEPGKVTIEYGGDNPVFCNGAGRYAVAWSCRAKNESETGWYAPTGRELLIEGMSILWPTDSGWMHRRFIDWNGVTSQLGGSRGRRSVDVLPDKLVALPDMPHENEVA